MVLYGSDAINHIYTTTTKYLLKIDNGKCTLTKQSSTASGADKHYTVVTPYSIDNALTIS